MQVSKAAVVATGALAAAAAMGSTPAFAADGEGTPAVTPATVGLIDYEAKHRASDEAMRELAEQWLTVAPEQTWPAPWEREPRQILSLGRGSVFRFGTIQRCGSHGPALGGASVPMDSPATVLGDCDNGNIDLANGGGDNDPLFSILDGSVVSGLAIQDCGTGVDTLGVGAPMASPATVGGDCRNGNVSLGDEPDEPDPGYDDDPYYRIAVHDTTGGDSPARPTAAGREEQTIAQGEAPWEAERQILSAGNDAVLGAIVDQRCGSHGPALGGASVPMDSPATVLGDCDNGNVDVDVNGDPSDALFTVLDRSVVQLLVLQDCASGADTLGVSAPMASPSTVGGDCRNGNVSLR